jgi:hypothetical protein
MQRYVRFSVCLHILFYEEATQNHPQLVVTQAKILSCMIGGAMQEERNDIKEEATDGSSRASLNRCN